MQNKPGRKGEGVAGCRPSRPRRGLGFPGGPNGLWRRRFRLLPSF